MFVLDPQKYADAAVHRRYLIPLAGHASVFTVVLNQIDATIESLRAKGFPFMPSPPGTYYERVGERVPGHGEPLQRLQKDGILLDGEQNKVLLQIFSANAIGPIFFEFIQRKGDEGFGHGNFRVLAPVPAK